MSRLIDPQRSKELTEKQSAKILGEAEVQALCERRNELFRLIRHQFRFIYRVDGHTIYDQHKEAKRAADRKIKVRERELIQQVQKEYDAIAAV